MDVVYSYFPLLDNPAFIDDPSPERHQEIMDKYPSGRSNYCLWTTYESMPLVALAYENAEEIYDHLMRFSKNQPSDYFNIEMSFAEYGYAVGLVPDLKHNIEMNNKLRMMMGKMPVTRDVKFLYSPLHFYHFGETNADVDVTGGTILFGLMDESEMEKPGDETNECIIVGEFEITDSGLFVQAMMEHIKEKSESLGYRRVF